VKKCAGVSSEKAAPFPKAELGRLLEERAKRQQRGIFVAEVCRKDKKLRRSGIGPEYFAPTELVMFDDVVLQDAAPAALRESVVGELSLH
jgi:hypothetical protein